MAKGNGSPNSRAPHVGQVVLYLHPRAGRARPALVVDVVDRERKLVDLCVFVRPSESRRSDATTEFVGRVRPQEGDELQPGRWIPKSR